MSALSCAISGFVAGCGFAALVMSIVGGYSLSRRALDEI